MNREKIKANMLKSAAQLWGMQAGDIAAFDPIVSIMLGACSVELEKVYNEIDSSNARVLERLAKLLLPDVNKSTQPAYGIVHAKPYEGSCIIKKYAQFFFSKRAAAKESAIRENTVDVFFSPVVDYPLISGSVKYLGTSSGLSKVDRILWKEKCARPSHNKVTTKFLWLGIGLDELDKLPEKLIFYFDWIENPFRERYLDFLPFTKWYVNDRELSFDIGIDNSNAADSVEHYFNYDNEFVTTQNILSFYRKRFVSLKLNAKKAEGFLEKKKYPDEFKFLYNDSDIQQLNEECLWIKIVFPPFITDDIIEQVVCQLNCFPVLNRKLNETIFRLHDSDTYNIIPLRDKNEDASFFSMESVRSAEGSPYISSKISELNDLRQGSYVIRKGGVQRFDQRNANEYLNYMIDLMRDESAAFSVYGQEMLSSKLKELSQLLALIEQKIQRSGTEEHSIDYLILRSQQDEDNVHIEYWSTVGAFANNIKIGSELSVYDADEVSSENMIIVSETEGGRDELTASEMLTAFKNSLTSRERVVTIADIRNVCYSEMGNLIRDVTVTKEFSIDAKSKTGFRRIIKVKITPANSAALDDKDWAMHKLRLESIIKNSSFANTPVEITIG